MLVDIDIIMRIFMKKNLIPNFYKHGENDHSSRRPYKPCENSLIYFLSLLVQSFEEEI